MYKLVYIMLVGLIISLACCSDDETELLTTEEQGDATQPADVTEPEPIGLPDSIIGIDGAEMILIPAGEFRMGTGLPEIPRLVEWAKEWYPDVKANWFADEKPLHTVHQDAFYIDKYEVTNAQYEKFMEATAHRAPESWNNPNFNAPDQPVVGVSGHDAGAYAKWAVKRLPTEAEWEKAARGGLVGKKYPWGDSAPDGTQCNFADGNTDYTWSDESVDDGHRYTAPVGSYMSNGYGLYDMAGNVLEWCGDTYDKDFYWNSPKRNPRCGRGLYHVLRGGSWRSNPVHLRVASRLYYSPADSYDYTGFRCAQTPRRLQGKVEIVQ